MDDQAKKKKSVFKRWWFWVIIVILVIIVVAATSGEDEEEAENNDNESSETTDTGDTETTGADDAETDEGESSENTENITEDEEESAAITITEGTYRVGTDISAGEYLFTCNSEYSAYVCIYNNSTADSEILFNENFDNTYYLTVEEGQYLYIVRCDGTLLADDESSEDTENSSEDEEEITDITIAEGMYRVGTDIPAGEYLFTCNSEYSAYVCVYNNSTVDGDILTNENFDNTYYLTVEEGQYLFVVRCDGTLLND